MNRYRAWSAMAAITALAFCQAVRADVLVLKNGKEMKGIVEDNEANTRHVYFIGAAGRQAIPRARVERIEVEPPEKGYIHIGDEFMRQGKLEDALKSYKEALRTNADSEEASQRVQAAEEALQIRRESEREDDVRRGDALQDEIRRQIENQKFAEVEQLFEEASALAPTPRQKQQLRGLVGDLYLAWAKERLDKFDKPGAEEKLNLALAATPENNEIVENLLRLWEDQPEKREQMLRIYEAVLDRRPEDSVMRRKVADLNYDLGNFEESVVHYMKLYNSSEAYKGTGLEKRVVSNLQRLHMRNAQERNYDQAIFFFNMLASIDSSADPGTVKYYEYLKLATEVAPDDVEGRIGLAAYCERNGLKNEALLNYRQVTSLEPENETALAALNRFAIGDVETAETVYNAEDYPMAETLANQVISDYPESEEARLRALELIGKTQIKVREDRREKRALAMEYVRRGDICYDTAIVFYRDISDTTRVGNPLLSTPKRDAIRHFECARDSYRTALSLDSSLSDQPGSLIGYNLNQSVAYLKRLKSRPPRFGRDQSRRPIVR